jgi:uncharacterized protein HemX
METGTPVPEVGKKSKVNGLTIALIIFLLAALGLGIWGYMLNSNLQTTRASQSALQKKYDTLTTDTNTLTTNLEQARSDLEKAGADLEQAKKDLTTTQSDLTKTADAITAGKADIAKAVQYLDVAVGLFVDQADLTAMTAKVSAVNDPKLTEKFEKYTNNGSVDDLSAWLGYLFGTVVDLLK